MSTKEKNTQYESEIINTLTGADRWAVKNAVQNEILALWIKQGCKKITVFKANIIDLYLLKSVEFALDSNNTSANNYSISILKIDVENKCALLNTSHIIKRMSAKTFNAISEKNELNVAIPSEILEREQELNRVRADEHAELQALAEQFGYKIDL